MDPRPLTGKCLTLPEVALLRSVQRKTGNENKITRANMQMKQNQRKTPPHSRRSDGGNPWPPVTSCPARTADSSAAGEARAKKQTFWGPSSRLPPLTLPPSRPPKRKEQEKRLCKQASEGWGKWSWKEGRDSESAAVPGSRKEKVSPFSPRRPRRRGR